MPFDSNAFFNNPWTQMGLGILGANQPGVGTAAAIGGGASAGLNNLMRLQLMKEDATLRKTKAEMLKEEFARAKAQAQQDAEIRRVQDERLAREYPELVGASEEEKKQFFKNQYQTPMGFTRGPDGKLVADENWLLAQERLNKAKRQTTTTNIQNTFTPPNPLESKVKSDLQTQSIAAKTVVPMIDGLISDIQALPSGVGGVAGARENVAGVSGQFEAVGIPGAGLVKDLVRPKSVVIDPTVEGGKRTVTPQSLQSQSEALQIRLKPLIADSGPLSNQDRARLERASGMTSSSDWEQRIEALMTIREVITNNAGIIDRFLREGGAGVPGAPVPTQEDFEYTAKKHNITVDEVKRRLGLPKDQ